jgi:predicted dehydrogenase
MLYTVNFENATADFDLGREQPLRLSRGGQTEAIDAGAGFGYAAELRYFIECVTKNQKPTVVTADDAVRSIKLVEAEVKSARGNGETVRI